MSRILIADDNPNIRHLLRLMIETTTGLEVCGEAGNGAEAVEKARDLNADVVLLDLKMPLLNGIEAASIIKRVLPHVRIVLFTMQMDGLGKTLASAIGIDFVISKEENITKLTEYLTKLAPVEPPLLAKNRQAPNKPVA